jgi:cell fate regulator YaaT (PSP1 superfamily)
MSEQTLIGVQFRTIGKSYLFYLPEDMQVDIGDYVIVNTVRGKQIGKVTRLNMSVPENVQEIQSVERLASSKDLIMRDMIKQKEAEAVEMTQQFLVDNPTYEGVKALDAEYSFDSSRLTLFLSYDNVPDFNMRNFIREAAPMFQDARVEIRQVGPRDMAKDLAGLGACGIEKRCCSRFMTEFSSISIRMAKSQNVSLTPSEITGICGRLRCCLAFEHEIYDEARKLLPRLKKVIQTPLGEGKVVQVLPLSDSVVVDIPTLGPREIKRSELESGKMEVKKPVLPEYEAIVEEANEDVEVIKLTEKKKPTGRSGTQRSKGRNRNDRSKQGYRKDRQSQKSNEARPEQTEKPKTQGKQRSSFRRDRRSSKPKQTKKTNEN